MASKLINFRDEKGLGAFPDETPLAYRLFTMARGAIAADPVPVPPIVGDYVLFLDLSKWQGIIDFELMRERGIRVVWIKVSQGDWIDSKFESYAAAAIAAGLLVGFYYFADPEQTSISPEYAAGKFYNLIKGFPFISIWLDGERAGALTPAGLLDHYKRWWLKIFELDNFVHVYENYTRFSFFNPRVARSSFWRDYKIRLNAARYHLGLKSPWSDDNYYPLDWVFELIDFDEWQYSADGNGLGAWFGCESGSVDINAFRGSWSDFEIAYNLASAPPPVTGCQKTYARIVAPKGLNFREAPEIGSRIWFALPNGYDRVRILDRIEDGSNVWLKTGERQFCAYIYNGVKYCDLYMIEDNSNEDFTDDSGGNIGDPGDPGESQFIMVIAKERFPLGVAVGHDQACKGEVISGKPIIEHPKENRIIIEAGQSLKVFAKYKYSCKDSASDPFVFGSGLVKYYVACDGYPGAVSFVRADKVRKS